MLPLSLRYSGVLDAYKASWAATRGHAMKVWGIAGVNCLMLLPVITIIGIPVSLYLLFMYSAANAVLYAYPLKHPTPRPLDTISVIPLNARHGR